jgi:hypothetical protein
MRIGRGPRRWFQSVSYVAARPATSTTSTGAPSYTAAKALVAAAECESRNGEPIANLARPGKVARQARADAPPQDPAGLFSEFRVKCPRPGRMRRMKLVELARTVRSKNAGPLKLTLDLPFDDEAAYRRSRTAIAPSRQRHCHLMTPVTASPHIPPAGEPCFRRCTAVAPPSPTAHAASSITPKSPPRPPPRRQNRYCDRRSAADHGSQRISHPCPRTVKSP